MRDKLVMCNECGNKKKPSEIYNTNGNYYICKKCLPVKLVENIWNNKSYGK